jgi:TPR repeat protein
VLALVLVVCGGPLRAESFEDGLRAFRAGEPGRAHDIWLPLAGEGDAAAQYSLGKLFEHGEGPIHQDLTKAVHWYESAAAQGLPAAQNNLALMYAQGRGVSGDLGRAIQLWRAAAERSYPWAQYNLGLAYFRGQGVAIDQSEAAVWFRRAADGGLAEAQFIMGQLKREGLGLEKDEGEALAWYHRAAEQGHLRARKQANVLKAEGVEPIPPKAMDTAKIPAQELAASLPKPSSSKARNGSQVQAAPQVSTGQSNKASAEVPAKSKPKSEAKAPGKQPKAEAKSSAKKKANTRAAAEPKPEAKNAAEQQSAPAKSVPKGAPKDKAKSDGEAPARKQTAKAQIPDKAEAASTSRPKQKTAARPKTSRKPKPKTSSKSEMGDTEATLEVENSPSAQGKTRARENSKTAATPEPLVRRQEANGQSAPKTGVRSTPEPAAAQSAARPPVEAGSSKTEPGDGYRVWLASAGSKSRATKLWRAVQDRHPNVLAGIDVDFARVDLGGEALFRVLAGPLASAAAAEQLCERLREAQPDAFCKVRAD